MTGQSGKTTPSHFLVDTQVKEVATSLNLQAINASPIRTNRELSLTLKLWLTHVFHWVFIIADLPIISADFLCHYNLLVDVKN